MEAIQVIVDGINKELTFNLQQDNWYYNEDYNLNISPTLNSCILESNSYSSPIEIESFKVLINEENLQTNNLFQ